MTLNHKSKNKVTRVVKNPLTNARDIRSLDPWLGKSPTAGHVNPLQYSCLENLMDSRAC